MKLHWRHAAKPLLVTAGVVKADVLSHINIDGFDGLPYRPFVIPEQVRTIDKKRLRRLVGSLDDKAMAAVDKALSVSFGL